MVKKKMSKQIPKLNMKPNLAGEDLIRRHYNRHLIKIKKINTSYIIIIISDNSCEW